MQPLGRSLAEIAAKLGLPTDQDWPLEYLVALPATADVQTELDATRADVDGEGELAKARRLATIPEIERRIRQARRRDELQSERPDGCFCLGLGGRGTNVVKILLKEAGDIDRGELEESVVVLDEIGQPLQGYREYCSCDDGQRLKSRVARLLDLQRSAILRQRIERAWGTTGIERRFADCSLDSYLDLLRANNAVMRDDVKLIAKLRSWLTCDGDPWLVLWGPIGHGKSGLAIGLARLYIEQGRSVLIRKVPELLDRLRQTYGDEGESLAALEQSMSDVELLVLDDLGADETTRTGKSSWPREKLFKLINHRYDNLRRTIITTNLEPVDLAAHVTDRTFDRIREMAGKAWYIEVKRQGETLRDILERRHD
jgi:hypothetical protein